MGLSAFDFGLSFIHQKNLFALWANKAGAMAKGCRLQVSGAERRVTEWADDTNHGGLRVMTVFLYSYQGRAILYAFSIGLPAMNRGSRSASNFANFRRGITVQTYGRFLRKIYAECLIVRDKEQFEVSVHLYLAPMPLPIGFGPPMLLATTPESAIALLETGRVSRLSVAKEWEEDCDPTNRVRRFYERELLAGKQMPEWLIEDFQTLVKTRSAKTKTTKMVMVE